MRYTYKDEYVIHDMGDRVHVVHVLLWGLLGWAALLYDLSLSLKGGDPIGGIVIGPIFLAIGLIFGLHGSVQIKKRLTQQMARRRRAMAEGTRYGGTIVAAGGGRVKVSEDYEDDDGNTRTLSYREPNYWIEVEYVQDGAPKRFKAVQMYKKMARFVGCSVDVYLWREWSVYIQKEVTLVYIDTYGLH